MWRPSVVLRIILGISGVAALLVGMALWGLETEYGGEGGAGSEMEILSDGTVKVYESDEQQVDEQGNQLRVLVFEGTQDEFEVWSAENEVQGRNYLIPGLVIAVGAVLLIGAVLPPIGKREDANPSEEV